MLDAASIAALATSAVTLLGPFLQKAAEKGAEEIGKSAIGGLLSKFKARLTHEGSKGALVDLAEQPQDPAAQGALTMQLRKALKEDPSFAEFLEQWTADSKREAPSISQQANTYGDYNKVTQITGSGNHVG